MTTVIIPSTLDDLDTIFELYTLATEHQKKVFNKHWLGFDRSMITQEIIEKRHWKIMEGDEIACIFSITYNDPQIWRDRDLEPSVYLHRISTNPSFRGRGYVKDVITWAKEFAKNNGKKFLRLDTYSDNKKLVDIYLGYGFQYLESTIVENTVGMPKHYVGLSLALFEMPV